MSNNNTANGGGMTIGVGIPSVVIGALIALKKAGMTTMSYGDIIWFGIEIFFVCAIIGLFIWFIIVVLAMLFSKY